MNLCRFAVSTLFITVLFCHSVGAEEAGGVIPEKFSRQDQSCRDIEALAAKYGVQVKLPLGQAVDRKELAAYYLAILARMREKAGKDGRQAIPQEDVDCVTRLNEALKPELAESEGYKELRETIESMLAKPETPGFEYKVGVNGFLRGEGVGNFRLPDFSYAPGHSEGRFVYRVKPYVYWHPTDWIDIHAEGQGYGFAGGSQESNTVSLYQGFVEVKTPGKEWLSLKGGRQEFSYGSTFIIGTDSFYNGLSLDAARLRVRPSDPLTIDLLVGSYATPFSDGIEGTLAGAYATWTLAEGNALEAYAFRDSGSTNHRVGEYLAIWGLRGTARLGPVALEFEPVYESGQTFNAVSNTNDRIDAFGGHLDATVEIEVAGHDSKLFTSFAYASGSRTSASGVSAAREFRNPENNTSLIGDLHIIGDLSGVTVNGQHASGLQIYTLGWGIDLTKELNLSATGRNFVANNTPAGFSPYLGVETDFTLTYTVNDNLAIVAGYDRFFTGSFFRDATGSHKDIDYGYLMLQFDLSHVKPKLRPPKG